MVEVNGRPIDYSGLPEHIREGFQRYIEERCEMGGFGMAVVENDLKEACGRADSTNARRLWDIVAWLYNSAPSQCWGSPEKVAAWLVRPFDCPLCGQRITDGRPCGCGVR